jgi:hypothetical protein
VIRPLSQRGALLFEIVVGIVRRDDSWLRMIQASLRDFRPGPELGEPGAYRSPKVMQREGTYLVLGKGLEVPRDAAGQEPWIHDPVTGFCGEYPWASAGQPLQASELFHCGRGQRDGETNTGLGSLSGDVPNRRLDLKVREPR